MAARLSALQFFFALTWIVYVIYLPALAVQAGIDKRYVPYILLMDQAIFIACDWAAGVYADRVAKALGRVGERMAMVTAFSCAAFIALPWVAPAAGAATFLVLTALWSATSSALRAPPLSIVSRYAPRPQQPWIPAFYLFGLGAASALAPYVGLALKGVDPKVPFAAASVAVVAFTLLLAAAENARLAPMPAAKSLAQARASPAALLLFSVASLLFALGFQVHFSINSAPGYLRLAAPDQLPHLMAVFWIGFNLAMLPASLVTKRFGGVRVMAASGAAGVLMLAACPLAATIEQLVAAQLAAGAAWGFTLMAAFTAALEAGRPGREGWATGALSSVLAGAAFARLAFVASGLSASPMFVRVPAYAWAAAALLVALIALTPRPSRSDAGPGTPSRPAGR